MVTVDDWFPAIDVNAVRESVLMGDSIVTHDRLVAAIEGALIHAMRQLAVWRSGHAAAGIASLADVPDPEAIMINDEPRALILWRRIIRFYTAAEVADIHRRLIATDQQIQRSDEQRLTGDEYRRMGHNAVADLKSIGADAPVARNSVELI